MRVRAAREFAGRRLTPPSLHTVWVVIVLAGLFVFIEQRQIRPNDFWWHLRLGELIVETRSVPTLEPFGFTIAGERWLDQPWLAQVLLYATFEVGGAAAILLLHGLAITGGYALVLLAVRPRDYGRAGAIAVLVGAAAGSMNWAVRPQMFSFLLFGALIYAIERHRRGDVRWLWLSVPIFLVWANTHGVFVYGVAVLGIYISSRLVELALRARRGEANEAQWREGATTAAIGLLALAVLALTPLGPAGLVRYLLVQSGPVTRNLGEWEQLGLASRDGVAVLGSALLLVALGWRLRGRRLLSVDQWLTIALALVLTLYIRRAAAWYGLVLIAPLATLLAAWLRSRPGFSEGRGNPRLNGALIAAAVAAALLTLPFWRAALPNAKPLIERHTPIAATAALCERLPDDARVFQHFAFASYQSWACARLEVFVDSRLYPFPFEQWDDYRTVTTAGEDWEVVLDRYEITHLFLSTQRQGPAIVAARASTCWRAVYSDAIAEIFERACAPDPTRLLASGDAGG